MVDKKQSVVVLVVFSGGVLHLFYIIDETPSCPAAGRLFLWFRRFSRPGFPDPTRKTSGNSGTRRIVEEKI